MKSTSFSHVLILCFVVFMIFGSVSADCFGNCYDSCVKKCSQTDNGDIITLGAGSIAVIVIVTISIISYLSARKTHRI